MSASRTWVLLRGPRLVVAELKVARNVVSPEQDVWLKAFALAGVEAYTWWPEHWPEIEQVLT